MKIYFLLLNKYKIYRVLILKVNREKINFSDYTQIILNFIKNKKVKELKYKGKLFFFKIQKMSQLGRIIQVWDFSITEVEVRVYKFKVLSYLGYQIKFCFERNEEGVVVKVVLIQWENMG